MRSSWPWSPWDLILKSWNIQNTSTYTSLHYQNEEGGEEDRNKTMQHTKPSPFNFLLIPYFVGGGEKDQTRCESMT